MADNQRSKGSLFSRCTSSFNRFYIFSQLRRFRSLDEKNWFHQCRRPLNSPWIRIVLSPLQDPRLIIQVVQSAGWFTQSFVIITGEPSGTHVATCHSLDFSSAHTHYSAFAETLLPRLEARYSFWKFQMCRKTIVFSLPCWISVSRGARRNYFTMICVILTVKFLCTLPVQF